MSQYCFDALNVIKNPVWLISPVAENILFANTAATKLMGDKTLTEMRTGIYSANAQTALSMYVPELKSELDIVEILTVWRDNHESTLSCRLTLTHLAPYGDVIVFEGLSQQAPSGLKASRSATYQRKKTGILRALFSY